MNEKILDIIINAITSEKINWTRTWSGTGAKNYVTKKSYRWANTYLNFIWDEFLTFNQIKQLKLQLKKGSKWYPVVYALVWQDKEDAENTKFLWWKYYTVFNCIDIEGMSQIAQTPQTPPCETTKQIENTKTILENYMKKENIKLEYGEPAYSPSKDIIYMPPLKNFNNNNIEYIAVLSHEVTHSTGTPQRLKRKDLFQAHKLDSKTKKRRQ